MKAQALLNVGQKADHGDGLDASESAADANFADLGPTGGYQDCSSKRKPVPQAEWRV